MDHDVNPIRVLLVEDDPATQELVRIHLSESRAITAELKAARSLAELKAVIQSFNPQVVLLDLSLPDGTKETTLAKARAISDSVAIIIFTGIDDEEFAMSCIKRGAQDYMVKADISPVVLSRTIHLAMARLEMQKETERNIQRMAEELQWVRHAIAPLSPIAARAVDVRPLSEAAPGDYEELASEYAELLEMAVDERAFQVDHEVRQKRARLATRLGALGADANDIVNIHLRFIEDRSPQFKPQAKLAYINEGRVMMLGILGDLVGYYRRHALVGHPRPDFEATRGTTP